MGCWDKEANKDATDNTTHQSGTHSTMPNTQPANPDNGNMGNGMSVETSTNSSIAYGDSDTGSDSMGSGDHGGSDGHDSDSNGGDHDSTNLKSQPSNSAS